MPRSSSAADGLKASQQMPRLHRRGPKLSMSRDGGSCRDFWMLMHTCSILRQHGVPFNTDPRLCAYWGSSILLTLECESCITPVGRIFLLWLRRGTRSAPILAQPCLVFC